MLILPGRVNITRLPLPGWIIAYQARIKPLSFFLLSKNKSELTIPAYVFVFPMPSINHVQGEYLEARTKTSKFQRITDNPNRSWQDSHNKGNAMH